MLHVALNFWDGWIDARNHKWPYYDPIRGQDWPGLARIIAEYIEAGDEITNQVILGKFDLRR